LTRQLAAALPDQTFHFTFTLVTDDLDGSTHEPKALPGGYIFVPAKLLLAAENEAEVAGMLAHAMVHVTARHYTRLATRRELMDIGSRPVDPDHPQIALAQLAMMRAMERQADYLAVQATASAGWDPAALAAYISRLQTDPTGSVSGVFDELPSRQDRVAAIQTEIQKLPPNNYTANSDEFAQVQAEIRKLVR
jgi:predicted Zn-dependent protease